MRAPDTMPTRPAIPSTTPGRRRGAIGAVVAAAAFQAAAPAATISFTDISLAAGINMTYAPNAMMVPGPDEWMLGGAAVADFNNDGWPDIFILGTGGTPDRLYINNGNGTFTDQAGSWGVAASHGGAAVCAGDYDRNGWVDLYVLSYGWITNNIGEPGKNRLYRNNGNGTFTDMAASAGVAFTGASTPAGNGGCFGDYDLDGDLDLAVGAWKGTANGNKLFRNSGNGTFVNVAGTAITFPANTWGFTPQFADMDNDGFPELLFVSDFYTTRYYKNSGGTSFVDLSGQFGSAFNIDGMGQCVADFNNDGLLDWYVTSIYLQNPNPGFYNGNVLFTNQGNHVFTEGAAAAGVSNGGWGWGSVAIDVDNDGWRDIVEVNGRPVGEWQNVREFLWRNNGNNTFSEVLQQGWSFVNGEGRAVVTLDYDRDGDLDLLMIYNNGPVKLYRNDTSGGGKWLQLKLSTGNNDRIPPNGRLAKVTAKMGSVTRVVVQDGGHSYGSSSEDLIQIGLGNASIVNELIIEFPPGYTKKFLNVSPNQRLAVTAPNEGDLDGDGVVGGGDIGTLLGVWGPVSGPTQRVADFDRNGIVDGADLGALLGYWGQ